MYERDAFGCRVNALPICFTAVSRRSMDRACAGLNHPSAAGGCRVTAPLPCRWIIYFIRASLRLFFFVFMNDWTTRQYMGHTNRQKRSLMFTILKQKAARTPLRSSVIIPSVITVDWFCVSFFLLLLLLACWQFGWFKSLNYSPPRPLNSSFKSRNYCGIQLYWCLLGWCRGESDCSSRDLNVDEPERARRFWKRFFLLCEDEVIMLWCARLWCCDVINIWRLTKVRNTQICCYHEKNDKNDDPLSMSL